MKQLSLALAFTLALTSTASAAQINVMDGHHDVANGSVTGHLGLVGLGHTTTVLAGTTGNWATATSQPHIIVAEQESTTNANVADVASFISGGGRFILLGSSFGPPNLINALFGTSLTMANVGGDLEPFNKTAAAVGTTFADDAATIVGLSSHHEVVGGTLPAGSEVFYEGAGDPIVFRSTLGSGDFFYLGWDYCCAGTTAQANDWYGVLDSAINFASTPAVPEPSTLALLGLGGLGLIARRRKAREVAV